VLPAASEVTFPTADGLELSGWIVPAESPSASAAVLVFNGNAGHRAYRAPLAAAFARAGLTVLLFDYRGYGGNPGRPTEQGLIRDGEAARDFLESWPGIDPNRIVYFGESLGAAVALGVAVHRPPAALVLRSPFVSMAEVAGVHYPFLPVRWMLRDRYPSIERIAVVDSPLLVIAGQGDRIVPLSQSRRLFEAASGPTKRFEAIDGADHNDAALAGAYPVQIAMKFLRQETNLLSRPEAAAGREAP